jgi:hypothetical protein
MQAKKKLCSGCGEPKIIWKFDSETRNRYCQRCWASLKLELPNDKPKPTVARQPIARVSDKRAKEERIYAGKRIIFLNEHPNCEINLPGICTGKATDVHHTYFGKDRDKYYLIVETWKAGCRQCHNYIHDHMPAEVAIELGLKKVDN